MTQKRPTNDMSQDPHSDMRNISKNKEMTWVEANIPTQGIFQKNKEYATNDPKAADK